MKIHVLNRQKDLPLSVSSVRKLVRSVILLRNVTCQEISIYFVSEAKITQLHGEFFNDPTSTDCISFPIDSETLGEVFVCPKVAMAYASKNHIDPYDETALYVIHGILHLLGDDDLSPIPRRKMRKNEKKCTTHYKALNITLRPE